MVLKKSKFDLNSGNTLRKVDRSIIHFYQRGAIYFRFNVESIECLLDCLTEEIGNSDGFDNYWSWYREHANKVEAILQLTKILEFHYCLEMNRENIKYAANKILLFSNMSCLCDEVVYSLSKLRRWEIMESMINELRLLMQSCRSIPELSGINVRIVELSGFWASHQVVPSTAMDGKEKTLAKSSNKPRKSSSQHSRGVQRLAELKCNSDELQAELTAESNENKWSNNRCKADIEYMIVGYNYPAKLRSKPRKEKGRLEEEPKKEKVKGGKGSNRRWLEDIRNIQGCSATDFVDHEFGLEPRRKRCNPPIRKENAIKKETETNKIRDVKNQCKFFLTECDQMDEEDTEKAGKSKDKDDRCSTNLWQFVEFLIDDSPAKDDNNNNNITFLRCRKNGHCSRTEACHGTKSCLGDGPVESIRVGTRDGVDMQQVSDLKPMSGRRKKELRGQIANSSEEMSDIYFKVKAATIQTDALTATYGSIYKESTFVPRTFSINISDCLFPDPSDVSYHSCLSDNLPHSTCLAEWTCVLVFTELPVKRSSYSILRLSVKMGFSVAEQQKLRDAVVALFSFDSVFPICKITSFISGKVRELSIAAATTTTTTTTAATTIPASGRTQKGCQMTTCCPRASRKYISRFDWLKTLCHWQLDIYTPDEYSKLLITRNISSARLTPCLSPKLPSSLVGNSPRPPSANSSRPATADSNRICSARNGKSLRKVCELCSASVVDQDPEMILGNSTGERKSHRRNARCAANTILVLQPCKHHVCRKCLLSAVKDGIRTGNVLEACLIQGCLSPLDTVAIISVVPLSVFRSHLQCSLDRKISKHPQWNRCPNANCHRAVKLGGTCMLEKAVSVVCHCGVDWCFHCLLESHWPVSCHEAKLYHNYLRQEELVDLYVSFTVMMSSISSTSSPLPSADPLNLTEHTKPAAKTVTLLSVKKHLPRPSSSTPATITCGGLAGLSFPAHGVAGLPRKGLLCPLPQKYRTSLSISYPGLSETTTALLVKGNGYVKSSLLPVSVDSKHSGDSARLALGKATANQPKDNSTKSATEWFVCLRCLDFTPSDLQLPGIFSEIRHQTRSSACASLVPLLLYRLAINHRSLRAAWSQPKIERSAQKLARQIMKWRTTANQPVGRDLSADVHRTNGLRPKQLSKHHHSKCSQATAVHLSLKMESEIVFFISVHEFLRQAHTLMEFLYIMLLNQWMQKAAPSELLCASLTLEAIVDSIVKAVTDTRHVTSSVLVQLNKCLDEGRTVFAHLVSAAASVRTTQPRSANSRSYSDKSVLQLPAGLTRQPVGSSFNHWRY